MKKLALALLLSSITSLAAPTAEPMIDLNRVSPIVKKRFEKIGANEFTSPEQFTLSCGDALNPAEYSFNHMAFEVDADLETVWNTYVNSDPKTAWNGKSIQFDFAYSKRDQAAYYHDDTLPAIHEGMGFFLILDIYQLKKIPVGLEISKIDVKEKVFEYTYLTQNVSHGRQTLRFTDLGNGHTRIVHDTYFSSGKDFRDRLYPRIHEALLEDFHGSILGAAKTSWKRTE